MEKEQTTLKGRFHIAVVREGQIVEERDSYNIVTAAGKALVSGLILTDVTVTACDFIAIGTGTSAPTTAQTALVGEKYRNACTGSQTTTTVPNDTARLTCSVAITATATMSEAGVFNATASGTMLARSTYSAISVNSGDTLNIGYDVAVA